MRGAGFARRKWLIAHCQLGWRGQKRSVDMRKLWLIAHRSLHVADFTAENQLSIGIKSKI
jgi:hypothetical protein